MMTSLMTCDVIRDLFVPTYILKWVLCRYCTYHTGADHDDNNYNVGASSKVYCTVSIQLL
jgi:hypothetical protein